MSKSDCKFKFYRYLPAVAMVAVVIVLAFLVSYTSSRLRMIRRVAVGQQVDPRLVSAVIWQESRFRPGRRGAAGEIGLMQVTEAAAVEWALASGVTNFNHDALFDPYTNLQAGVWYLGRAIRRWENTDDPLPYALAEYNAGPSNARRWAQGVEDKYEFVESITYPSTRRYVREVLKRYRGGL